MTNSLTFYNLPFLEQNGHYPNSAQPNCAHANGINLNGACPNAAHPIRIATDSPDSTGLH